MAERRIRGVRLTREDFHDAPKLFFARRIERMKLGLFKNVSRCVDAIEKRLELSLDRAVENTLFGLMSLVAIRGRSSAGRGSKGARWSSAPEG